MEDVRRTPQLAPLSEVLVAPSVQPRANQGRVGALRLVEAVSCVIQRTLAERLMRSVSFSAFLGPLGGRPVPGMAAVPSTSATTSIEHHTEVRNASVTTHTVASAARDSRYSRSFHCSPSRARG